MFETLWYILLIAAIILMILISYMEYNEDFPIQWILMFTFLDTIIWFLLASAIFEIEIPGIVYNNTTGAYDQGLYTVTSKTIYAVSMFCNMMGAVMMTYGAYAVFMLFKELYDEHTGRIK